MGDVRKTLRLAGLAGWPVTGEGEILRHFIQPHRIVRFDIVFNNAREFRPWSDLTDCAELATALRKAGKIAGWDVTSQEDEGEDYCQAWVESPASGQEVGGDIAFTPSVALFLALVAALLPDGGGE